MNDTAPINPAKPVDSRERRTFLLAGAAFLAASPAMSAPARPRVEVWKDPSCGCCKDWVSHMEAHGFDVQVHETGNAVARRRFGMPSAYGSCHTAVVDGYVIEGHVPGREVQRLLKERPTAVGIAVPGMPIGAPGMDGPVYGGRKDPYDVVLVLRDGSWRVFQSYR
jgi:hypothetical protein